jgi:hypothetical protein
LPRWPAESTCGYFSAERRIEAERADEPEDRRPVPFDETVEGVPVSRFHASEECYVVFGFGVDGHVLMPNKC